MENGNEFRGRKIQSWKRYFAAFLIGTFVFILVFAFAYSISYFESQRIGAFQEQTSYSIFEDKLLYSFFQEESCEKEYLIKISADLDFQGMIIEDLERKFGKNDEKVLFKKRFYTLAELEHFEFVKQMNEHCGLGLNTILFFYSNVPPFDGKSEEFGDFLSALKKEMPEVLIYSFDSNLDSPLIPKLKEKYNITKVPTIVINEKVKITQINNIDGIKKYLANSERNGP